jgi:hypothetical protein
MEIFESEIDASVVGQKEKVAWQNIVSMDQKEKFVWQKIVSREQKEKFLRSTNRKELFRIEKTSEIKQFFK